MRHRPVIGITPGIAGPSANREFARASRIHYCDEHYLRAIVCAGGIPIVLAHTDDHAMLRQMAETVDGVLLTGGEDVNPSNYGEKIRFPEFAIADERDRFEIEFLSVMMPTRKPVLAICRGHQVVNVALGGSLIQDIPALMGSAHHAQTQLPPATVHQVDLREGSRVARVLGGQRVSVNSYHHQAIDRLAPDLSAVGFSEEGLVEAVEHKSHPYFIGVQWHPERLCKEGLVHSHLFADFVDASRAFV